MNWKEFRLPQTGLIHCGQAGGPSCPSTGPGLIQDKQIVHKLFAEIKDRFFERNGGYTKITKLRYRKGDAAPVSVIEWVDALRLKRPKRKRARPREALDKVKGMMPGQGKKEEESEKYTGFGRAFDIGV